MERISKALSAIVIMFGLGWSSMPGFAQMATLSQGVLETIGEYASTRADPVGTALRELGYTPGAQRSWEAFPSIRKLEVAYRSAEAAAPGGGDKMLAEVASKLSQRYDSLRNAPTVAEFIGRHSSAGAVAFRETVGRTMFPTTTEVRTVIAEIAKVADGRLGGSYGIITRDFGISPARAYEIVAGSTSNLSALSQAYRELPEGQRTSKLQALVTRAKAIYPALGAQMSIVMFEASVSSPRPSVGAGVGTRPSPFDRLNILRGGDEMVECTCSDGRFLGRMPASQCVGPC